MNDETHGMDEFSTGLTPEEEKSIAEAVADAEKDLGLVMNVPLNVSVELGRSELTIKDLLQLVTGSVVELDKLAGEPLEILVNGRDIARGEVVVINEKFGIRLTDIINPFDSTLGDKSGGRMDLTS